jgi:hypothetical protein
LAAAFLLAGLVTAAPPDPTPGPSQPVREQNLDPDGWIAVHEQGTAEVNVVGGSLSVSGSVSVDNFPATQNVQVTGPVTTDLSPVIFGISDHYGVQPDEIKTFSFPLLNATTLSISNVGGEEYLLGLLSPVLLQGPGPFSLGGGPVVFSVTDTGGNLESVLHSFTRPIPVNGIVIRCLNESESCSLDINIVGT